MLMTGAHARSNKAKPKDGTVFWAAVAPEEPNYNWAAGQKWHHKVHQDYANRVTCVNGGCISEN